MVRRDLLVVRTRSGCGQEGSSSWSDGDRAVVRRDRGVVRRGAPRGQMAIGLWSGAIGVWSGRSVPCVLVTPRQDRRSAELFRPGRARAARSGVRGRPQDVPRRGAWPSLRGFSGEQAARELRSRQRMSTPPRLLDHWPRSVPMGSTMPRSRSRATHPARLLIDWTRRQLPREGADRGGKCPRRGRLDRRRVARLARAPHGRCLSCAGLPRAQGWCGPRLGDAGSARGSTSARGSLHVDRRAHRVRGGG